VAGVLGLLGLVGAEAVGPPPPVSPARMEVPLGGGGAGRGGLGYFGLGTGTRPPAGLLTRMKRMVLPSRRVFHAR
jgi:hypothetical protein